MLILQCPLCQAPLAPGGNAYHCTNRHAFDLAREGYLNLLPVQHKKSRDPGDNADMVRARREFLAAGHYAPLRDAVAAQVAALAPASVLDIGCGEGYYTAAMQQGGNEVVALDIGKAAIRLAAKRYPGVRWLVASAARLPLADGSVDLACSLFAPLPAGELARVLRPGGHLLLATPAPGHLAALRAALFDQVEPHRPEKLLAPLAADFAPAASRELAVPLALSAVDLANLLLMTPYAWRAKPERRAALAALPAFGDTAVFRLYLLRRR